MIGLQSFQSAKRVTCKLYLAMENAQKASNSPKRKAKGKRRERREKKELAYLMFLYSLLFFGNYTPPTNSVGTAEPLYTESN